MAEVMVTLGYGFHMPESVFMLAKALESPDKDSLRSVCIAGWPQASETNKARMWIHLSNRYLQFGGSTLLETPFLAFYRKLRGNAVAEQELIFHQLCQTTPILLRTLRSLAATTLFSTGQASFTKYHLDQLLASLFGHVTKSTCERVRQILMQGGRLSLQDKKYVARPYCPSEAVLGYGLYADAEKHGWRALSTQTIVDEGDLCPTFLCSRPLLVAGLQRLANQGFCEFHRHGSTDQVQLVQPSLRGYVDAWKP